jgi:hypothetical protein
MPFDPDAYLGAASQGFNPDDYLKGGSTPAPAQKAAPYKSPLLPMSIDENGKPSLDWSAGIIGAVKDAVTLPRDVWQGKVDPMSDEGLKRSLNMASVISPVSAAMEAGEKAVPGVVTNLKQAKVNTPSAEALKEAATKGYNAAKEMGVEYSSSAVTKMAGDIQRTLEKDGVLAELSPKTFAILSKLQDAPESSVATLEGLDAARKALGHAAGDFANKTEQFAARRAIEELDGFLASNDPSSVVAGAATSARDAIKAARGNYAAASRSETVADLARNSELRADATASGQNLGNTLRQRLASLLQSDKATRGFSPEEIAAAEEAVKGSKTANALRYIGNYLGGGGGLGANIADLSAAGVGAVAGGPGGAIVGPIASRTVGAGSKALSNALTKSQVNKLDEMIRQRSPLYQDMLKNAPLEVRTPDKAAALIRALQASSLDKDSQQ